VSLCDAFVLSDAVKNDKSLVFESYNKKNNMCNEDSVLEELNVNDRLTPVLTNGENVNNYTMVFDTETNYLYGDIIQIAWIVIDYNNEIIKTVSMYIKNRKNNPEAYAINHITDQTLKEKGIEFIEVMQLFFSDLNTCKTVIGHNVQYDTKTVVKNIKKFKIPIFDELGNTIQDIFIGKKIICTMKLYKSFIFSIEKENGIKMSKKLVEMYKYFFGQEFENPHDALGDIMATFECYKKLYQLL
jgi:DNA polymerase III epsilon subunit-like protein